MARYRLDAKELGRANHIFEKVREANGENSLLDSSVQYAIIVTCDESIGSLEPFALRRSTLDCNAGADLE